MGIIRRLAILSICLAFTSAAYTCAVWAQDFKVTLLGTGVPFPATDRFGAATLGEAGQERLVVHAGRGGLIRRQIAVVSPGTVQTLAAHPLRLYHHLGHIHDRA